MGRGQEILYGDPLLLRSKSLVFKRQGGPLFHGADAVSSGDADELRVFSFSSGQGITYSLDALGAIKKECYLPDCRAVKKSFAHGQAFVWSNTLNREIRAAFAPGFLQTRSFPLLGDNEEEQGFYLTSDKLYAAVLKDGLLSLQQTTLNSESSWRSAVDEVGDKIENIIAWNKEEQGALIVHRSKMTYKLTHLSFSGEKKTWPIKNREVFDSHFPDFLASFSFSLGASGGEFYYLDPGANTLERLRADEGRVEKVADLRGSPRAFTSLQSTTLILYDDQRLDVIDNSKTRAPQVLLLEKDFSHLSSLGDNRAALFSQDD